MFSLLAAVFFFISGSAAAQVSGQSGAPPDAEAVRAVIDQLFDGMRAGDAERVRAVFHPEARMQTTLSRGGNPILNTGSVDDFVEQVGAPRDDAWDERIWNVEIRVDGNLAQAWMDYAFFLGESFSHCGVNAIQFFRDGTDWKIIQIIDTRRTEGCDFPENP